MKVTGDEEDEAPEMVSDDDSSWKGDDRRNEKKTEVESSREQEHGDMGCRRSGLSTNHGIHCLI